MRHIKTHVIITSRDPPVTKDELKLLEESGNSDIVEQEESFLLKQGCQSDFHFPVLCLLY